MDDQTRKKFEKIYYTYDPVNSKKAKELKKLLLKVYTEVIARAYYVNKDTITIKYDKDSAPFKFSRLPIAVIISHLVNRSSTMLEGSPGCGKTRTVKIISRMMTGSSINDADNIIYCDEELSKDKWLAFPNVKKMMNEKQGQENTFDVIWAPFFREENTFINLIVDEINRANPKTQNELLSLMAEGIAQYGVSARVKKEDFRLFFTQNPLDEIVGSNIYPLSVAFKDRITQFIRVPQPPAYAMKRVSEVRKDDRNYEYDEDKEIKPIMDVEMIQTATILASKMKVTERAKKYAMYLVRDMNLCLKANDHDKTLCEKDNLPGRGLCNGCHFNDVQNYHCKKFYGGSMRIYNDIIAVAKAYAFFLDLREVNEYLIRSIAPDIISHRVFILPEALQEDKTFGNDRRKFLQQYLIDWCFSLLNTRKEAEEAFDNLYYGKSTKPEADQRVMLMSARNDIYVLVDLLPKVIETNLKTPDDLGRKDVTIMSSTATFKYREKIQQINNIMDNGDLSIEKKRSDLIQLAKQIPGEKIDFFGNLIDVIYSMYPKLQTMKEQMKLKSS